LNEIKQREQFRPVALIGLEEDAAKWFNCDQPSPFMLYKKLVTTVALAAVTHINRTARIQTVSTETNNRFHKLLVAFKMRTGFGVLCNTSLNFKGKGFINNIYDLSAYTIEHELDGFVIEGQCFMLRSSPNHQRYKRMKNTVN
jgi:Predicted carbamoyl transferase, NodU family